MASGICDCGKPVVLWIFFLLCVCHLKCAVLDKFQAKHPYIDSVYVVNESLPFMLNTGYNKTNLRVQFKLEFKGQELFEGLKIKPTTVFTSTGSECVFNDNIRYHANEVWSKETTARFDLDVNYNGVPVDVNFALYFCIAHEAPLSANALTDLNFKNKLIKWIQQSDNVSVKFRTKHETFEKKENSTVIEKNEKLYSEKKHLELRPRSKRADERNTEFSSTETVSLAAPRIQYKSNEVENKEPLFLYGVRIDQTEKDPETGDDGIPSVLMNTEATLRLFAAGLTENTVVVLTRKPDKRGKHCLLPATEQFKILPDSLHYQTGLVKIRIPVIAGDNLDYYICTREAPPANATQAEREEYDNHLFIHQGTDPWLVIRSHKSLLPTWASIIIVITCLCFSSLFSGLNLGLMALDRTELKILCNTGTKAERSYATQIQPVRDHGNYLLCSILLGNVLVNSIFTIILDSLTSGLIAVICSTLLIVIFGEITPQAICSRHGLAVGAKTIWITKAIMLITFPLSWPISKMLDFILGEEIGNVYNRERLKELVKVTNDINDLDKDEVNIISGALELRKKTVSDVMTRIEDVFMLDYEAILDFETVSEIMKSGYSRIPVYEGNRKNIVTMLYSKDLAFVDPDDNTPLKTLCQFYQYRCNFVFEDVTLDIMFKQFIEGHKGHMAFVHRVNNEGEGDPFYETIGLITLEDVIEELIQAEIMDETDIITDNRSKRRCNELRKQDFTIFAERRENHRMRISPQLTLATFQYLSTTVDIFKPDHVSETILRRMLKQDIIMHVKKSKDKNDPAMIIIQQNKPIDYFVLILEGRVEVTVGRESLLFESGPFTYFGTQALMQTIIVAESPAPSNLGSIQSINMESMLRHTFLPDYTVRAVTEVLYIRIKRSLYWAAKRATLMERSQRDSTVHTPGDQFDDEVEKLLHSLEEDGGSIGCSSPIQQEVADQTRRNTAEQTIQYSLSQNNSPSPVTPNTPSITQKSISPINGGVKVGKTILAEVSSGGDCLSNDVDKNDEGTALLSQKIKPS